MRAQVGNITETTPPCELANELLTRDRSLTNDDGEGDGNKNGKK